MRILIADDSSLARMRLVSLLEEWGHQVVQARSGLEAWEVLQSDPPALAILDWIMPDPDGPELCRRIRSTPALRDLYVLMLTGMTNPEDIVAGLGSGANDFIAKPFNEAELHARLNVGFRMVALQADRNTRIKELESALAEITQLRGFLPICAYCKSVRDDKNYWQSVERYIGSRSDLKFSHGICPKCMEEIVKPELERLGKQPPPV